jgi:DNA-binding CsgD family transcriptional regulator
MPDYGNYKRDSKQGYSDGPLSPRHRQVAMLVAQGSTNQSISDATGYDLNYISLLKAKPEFKLLVESIVREVQTLGIDQMVDELKKEFLPTVERLKHWRDQDEEPSVSLGATNSILDRILPKKTLVENHQTILRLEGDDIKGLLGVVNEYRNGNGNSTKEELDVTPPTIRAKTIDEMIAEDADAE